MLFVTIVFILIQFVLAVAAPARFIYFSLWVQTIPYWWNFDVQISFETPIGRLNVVAMQGFGFLLACLFVIVPHISRLGPQIARYKWHSAFLIFCVLSLAYAPSTVFGLRTIAKLAAPFLFLLAVGLVINTDQEIRKTLQAIMGSGAVILFLALLARMLGVDSDPNVHTTGVSGLGPPGMGPPVFSAHMLPVAMLSLATYLCMPNSRNLLIVMLAAAAILAAIQRTSAGALYIGFAVILFFGTHGVWRVILPTLGFVGFPALLVFSDTFRRRMFFDATSTADLLSDPAKALGQLNTSGRSALWDTVLKRFFYPHPITGSGIGSTQDFLYGIAKVGATVVHSEYIRLLCEVGIVGLTLFVFAAFAYLARLRKLVVESRSNSVRLPALASMGSLIAYLVFFSTDNGIDYVSQLGIYVFAMIAVAENSLAREPSTVQTQPAAATLLPGRPFPNLLN
jgi:O-antigen ligase